MIAKQALIEAAGRAAQNPARPLSAQCARAIGAQLERGDPPWWKAAEAAWKDRYFPSPDHALLLVIAALHHEGICGRPLAAVLPTCGGSPAALPKAVAAFLEAPSPEFVAALSRRFVNYSSFWASRWLEPAQHFFQRRAMPYAVVELNSVGGLGACADMISPKDGFDSSLVRERRAFSDEPLDLQQDGDAQWLLACTSLDSVGISDAARSARLLRELRGNGRFATTVSSSARSDPFLSAKELAGSPGGLLFFSFAWLSEMPPGRRAVFLASLADTLSSRGDAALWIEVDLRDRGAPALEARGYRMREGRLARQVLTSIELTATGPSRSAAERAAAFLS